MVQKALHSSSFTYTNTYDVFLSFRGEDTRFGFTGNLYSALCHRGVLTFIDDDCLRKGEEITPSLLNAIKQSRMAIVVLSKNYAYSTFCLNELVHIVECYTKQKLWIWPVFYIVDPSEVRYQTGSYGEAFSKHEQGRFKDDTGKVQKWRLALRQVADLSGWHFKHGGEYEHAFIRKIVEVVSSKLKRPLLHIANYPVGLEARLREVQRLMGADFDNKVNLLGIHGVGGIGKSTLARAIYNLAAYQFEGSCFLANIREKSTRHGLEQIQETMLFELTGERIRLGDVNVAIPILKERLRHKKIFLILDDIDKKQQLEAIAGGLDWFGLGSFVIITTRDKHLLDIHGVESHYEVNEFSDTEAVELFRWSALKNKEVDPSYMEIIKRAVYYAGGLPLALEVIGSNLFGKTLEEWKSALDAYERIPNRDVQEILRVSYDGLEENEKEIFLDIACFFKGCYVRDVTNILQARGFHPKYGIHVLEKKSLIKIMSFVKSNGDEEIFVTMHNLIQCMGKEIVRQQSTLLEKRNRLWFYEDIFCVLEKNKENDKIEAILLDMPEDKEVQWNQEAFGKMKNLKMLIQNNACFSRSPGHLPNSLRVFEWWGYTAVSLPSNLHFKNLVRLDFSYSCFQWDKPLENSKVLSHLIFTSCKSMRQIPDVSGVPNLTELCVDNCRNLIEIHDSVGFLENLQRFSAKGCTKLRIVPQGIKLTSLEYLSLRDCSSLVNFPEIFGPMEKLEFVDFRGTAIENLPLSMQNLRGVQKLLLDRSKMVESDVLSNSVLMLPNCFPFLKTLRIRDSNMKILPACIEECVFLEMLDLCFCEQLEEIRGLPPRTYTFFALNCILLKGDSSTLSLLLHNRVTSSARTKLFALPGNKIPEWFDHSHRGNSLCFWFCKEFPAITVCAVIGSSDNIPLFHLKLSFHVKTNDIEAYSFDLNFGAKTDHILMFNYFDFLTKMDRGRLNSEKDWNFGEISFVIHPDFPCCGLIKWIGVHVNQTFGRMEDVRFTNPYPSKSLCDDSCYNNHDTGNQLMMLSKARDIQQHQQQQLALFNPPQTIDRSKDQVGAFLYHQAMVSGESSQASVLAEKQNHQVRSPTSSSDQVRQEMHLCTISTMLPSTIDTSLRNQIELTQDDVEIEAFYASLDAEINVVSCSGDKSAITTPSEEVKEALKIVQDLIFNDASVLLHRERYSAMKTSLEYLSNVSAKDGISKEMGILISEASRELTNWSTDYIEASMKIKSTTSELQRADELEAGLEANKNRFCEVLALEKALLQKLAGMEKRKNDLEEQINAIKANISASELEKNMACHRKRDIFEEGKRLKIQRDELRKKAPHLQHQHDLAKETQTRIKVKWSELREKFEKITAGCDVYYYNK